MGALAVGQDGGQKLYILGVAGYNKPIWDVLALQGEREEAGERLYGAKFVELSKLGKRCQLGMLGLGFAIGLIVVGFSRINFCIIVETMYLHVICHFLCVWGRDNGWMALDGFG